MRPFAVEMAAILVHSLNRFSLCTKMAAMAVAKLLLCCVIICKRSIALPGFTLSARSLMFRHNCSCTCSATSWCTSNFTVHIEVHEWSPRVGGQDSLLVWANHCLHSVSYQARFMEFKIQNMVGSCDVKFPIRLEGLVVKHNQFSR